MRPVRNNSAGPLDRGQAIGLVLVAVVVIVTVAVAMAALAGRMTDRSAAQTAADAAALAGAIGGRPAAAVVAERNGGQLVAFDLDRVGTDVTVTVEVRVGGESRTARASNGP